MDRIIYVHIPKTAGSTMRQILTNNLGRKGVFAVGSLHATQVPWFHNQSQQTRDSFNHVLGHVRYGIHRWFSNGNPQYFTILRQPIERTLSAYSFASENKNLPHHEEVKRMTLGQYAVSRRAGQVQTEWLMGYVPDSEGITYYGDHAPLPDNALEIVKQRLADEFVVTGMVERFDESILLLQDAFHWKDVYYYRGNVTKKRLRYSDLSAEDKRALDEATGPDFELYDWARKRFDAQIEALGEPFQRRLAEFKETNKIVGQRRGNMRALRTKLRRMFGVKSLQKRLMKWRYSA